DRVHAGGRVGNECESGGFGANERGESFARVVEQRFELTIEKSHRFALELRTQFVLLLQHDARRRAVRAVIQEDDAGIEEPVLFHTMRATPSARRSGRVNSETTK